MCGLELQAVSLGLRSLAPDAAWRSGQAPLRQGESRSRFRSRWSRWKPWRVSRGLGGLLRTIVSSAIRRTKVPEPTFQIAGPEATS